MFSNILCWNHYTLSGASVWQSSGEIYCERVTRNELMMLSSPELKTKHKQKKKPYTLTYFQEERVNYKGNKLSEI